MLLAKGTIGRPHAAFSGFAVALGLCFLLPLLNYTREPPISDFFGEWASVVMFSSASLMLLFTLPRRQPLNVSLLLGPLVLAGVLAVHVALGTFAYAYDWIIWLSYLALLVLGLLVGQAVRGSGQSQEVLSRLAWTLIITAVLNFGIQVIQVLGFDLLLFPYVVPLMERSACRIYGNVGQANQATMLAWLAIGAVLYLVGTGKLLRPLAIALLLVLLLSSALAASRMAWLFLGVVVALLMGFRAWPVESRRMRGYLAATLALGLFLADHAARGLLATVRGECASGLQRFSDVGEAGFVIRAELWKLAIEIWETSPWIGTGAGSFLGKIYELAALDRHQPFDAYAHSSALQILAEFGLIGAGVIAALTILWIFTLVRRRQELDAKDGVLLAWVGVLCAYSMLEFPLWYAHFLLLFALLLGMLVRPQWNLPAGTAPLKASIAAVALVSLAGSAFVLRDYLALQRLDGAITMKQELNVASTPDVVARMRSLADNIWLYRLHTEHSLSLVIPLDRDALEAKITDSERLLRRVPQASTIAQRATLAALAGDLDTARYHLRRLFVFWPSVSDEIVGEMRAFVAQRPAELEPLWRILEEERARAPERRW